NRHLPLDQHSRVIVNEFLHHPIRMLMLQPIQVWSVINEGWTTHLTHLERVRRCGVGILHQIRRVFFTPQSPSARGREKDHTLRDLETCGCLHCRMRIGPDLPLLFQRDRVEKIPRFVRVGCADSYVMASVACSQLCGVSKEKGELESIAEVVDIPIFIPRATPSLIHPRIEVAFLRDPLQIHSSNPPLSYSTHRRGITDD